MTEDRQPETRPPAIPTERASDFALRILSTYGRLVRDYLRRRLPHHSHDLDDLSQEVYMRLLRVKDSENVRNPPAYVRRIAYRVIAEFLQTKRKGGNKVVSFEDLAPHLQDPPSDASSEDMCIHTQALERAFAQLPPMEQAVLLLRKRDGYSHTEVAKQLRISKFMVHKYLKQAYTRLREEPWDRQQ